MRKIIITLLLAAAAAGCSTTGQQATDWRRQGYDSVGEHVDKRVAAKVITRSEGNREMLRAARTYYPNDPLIAGVWSELVDAAVLMEAGTISREQYLAQANEVWARFDAVNSGRMAEHQAEVERQQRAALIGGALIGAGRGLQQANPPSVSCNSIAHGGQLTTTCR